MSSHYLKKENKVKKNKNQLFLDSLAVNSKQLPVFELESLVTWSHLNTHFCHVSMLSRDHRSIWNKLFRRFGFLSDCWMRRSILLSYLCVKYWSVTRIPIVYFSIKNGKRKACNPHRTSFLIGLTCAGVGVNIWPGKKKDTQVVSTFLFDIWKNK